MKIRYEILIDRKLQKVLEKEIDEELKNGKKPDKSIRILGGKWWSRVQTSTYAVLFYVRVLHSARS